MRSEYTPGGNTDPSRAPFDLRLKCSRFLPVHWFRPNLRVNSPSALLLKHESATQEILGWERPNEL